MPDDTDDCGLCERPLGNRVERHHLVPRSKGGRETVLLHPVCHRKIHSVFREGELATAYNTLDKLREHPEISRFVKWVSRRPPDFHSRTARPRRR